MITLTRIWNATAALIARVLGIEPAGRPKPSRVVESPPVAKSLPVAEPPPARKPPGLDCPRCGFRIMISMPMLLSGKPVLCPACGLPLSVDREQSRGCLNELQKLYEAVQRVEETKRA